MKLPTLFADTAPSGSGIYTTGRRRPSGAGLQLQAPAGCIDKCVGTGAATKCSYCNADLDCWETCAGPGTSACINNCFLGDLGKVAPGY